MNVKEALEIIKNADLSGDSKVNKVCNNMREIISRKTDNYKNPDRISSQKVDMTTIILKRGYSIEDYKRTIGDVRRSEEDVVIALAKRIQDKSSSGSRNETERERALRLADADAQAQLQVLEMLALTL